MQPIVYSQNLFLNTPAHSEEDKGDVSVKTYELGSVLVQVVVPKDQTKIATSFVEGNQIMFAAINFSSGSSVSSNLQRDFNNAFKGKIPWVMVTDRPNGNGHQGNLFDSNGCVDFFDGSYCEIISQVIDHLGKRKTPTIVESNDIQPNEDDDKITTPYGVFPSRHMQMPSGMRYV